MENLTGTTAMNHEHENPMSSRSSRNNQSGRAARSSWQARLSIWLLIGIAAFYLFSEHQAHLVASLSWLPLLLLLACPFIHFFGHGHHGSHGDHGSPKIIESDSPTVAANPETNIKRLATSSKSPTGLPNTDGGDRK